MANTNSITPDTRFLEIYSKSYVLSSIQSKEQIRINLETGSLKKEAKTEGDISLIKKVGIPAIYGICELESSKYLMVVSKSLTIGSIYNRNIYLLSEMKFIPINPAQQVEPADEKYIEMMQNLFTTRTFYFSDEYDLTNSCQRFVMNQMDKNKYNPNFCFNECYLQEFISNGWYEWISPFISGFVAIEYTQIDNSQVNFMIISRRDKRRLGMRFISRGTDLDGNPSNMGEQEQIIMLSQGPRNTIYSFVQTRGSMPFLWSQKANLQSVPKGAPIGKEKDNLELCRKHFADQEKLYPREVLINLIDKHGPTQLPLGQYYEKLVRQLNNKNLKFIWFDFHQECRKMKYENLQLLINQFKDDLEDIGYFEFTYNKDNIANPIIKKLQKGTVRTNCMDCLDRTNVVQSTIARNVLHSILYSASITDKTSTTAFEKFPDKLESIFRNNWAKNADVISLLYTGTYALKTDFTRTGKRTTLGSIQDTSNSIQRYFYGNFFDGHKQDCADLLLAKIKPKEQKISVGLNPMIFLVLVMIFSPFLIKGQLDKMIVPENRNGEHSYYQSFISFVSFIISILAMLKGISTLSNFFVQQPTLKQ